MTDDQRQLLDTLADQIAGLPSEAAGYLRGRLATQHGLHLVSPWTKKEELWLIDHYARLGCEACAAKLGRSIHAIQRRVRELRLTIEPWWTEDEEQHMRDHYKHDGPRVTAEELRRTIASVTTKAFRMKLKFSLQEKITIARGLWEAGYCDQHIGDSMGYSRAWWYPHRAKLGGEANGRGKCPVCRSRLAQQRDQKKGDQRERDE